MYGVLVINPLLYDRQLRAATTPKAMHFCCNTTVLYFKLEQNWLHKGCANHHGNIVMICEQH